MSGAEPEFLRDPGLRRSPISRALALLDRLPVDKGRLKALIVLFEGGEGRSRTLRALLWHAYGVRAEAFCYGGLLDPGASHPGLSVGRYASIARRVSWGLRHPVERAALTPYLYLPGFGVVDEDLGPRGTLEIGHDAWVGEGVVLTDRCRRVGIGAVVGAGSVVTRDVPDFAVAYGVPARVVRYRFEEAVRARLLASRWWELSPAELRPWRAAFAGNAANPATLVALDAMAEARRGKAGAGPDAAH